MSNNKKGAAAKYCRGALSASMVFKLMAVLSLIVGGVGANYGAKHKSASEVLGSIAAAVLIAALWAFLAYVLELLVLIYEEAFDTRRHAEHNGRWLAHIGRLLGGPQRGPAPDAPTPPGSSGASGTSLS